MILTISGMDGAGRLHTVETHGGPNADEHGFAIAYTLDGVYPTNRVHEMFAQAFVRMKIDWIVPHRDYWEVDLDRAREVFQGSLKAEWIHGRVQIEPDLYPEPFEGAIGLRPRTRAILRFVREEIILSQQNRIFLSHKSVDKQMVQRFHDVLSLLGFDPWLDREDILAGDNLHRELLKGMKSSCAAIFFITPQFRDEKVLKHEIELAMREKTERDDRFRIITLSLSDQNQRRGAVPDILRTYIFKEPATEMEALHEILRALPLRVGGPQWEPDRSIPPAMTGQQPVQQPTTPSLRQLEQPDLDVLKFFAQFGNGENVPLPIIMQELRLSEQRVRLACSRLGGDRNLVIAAGLNAERVQLYSITDVGREECHRHGWL